MHQPQPADDNEPLACSRRRRPDTATGDPIVTSAEVTPKEASDCTTAILRMMTSSGVSSLQHTQHSGHDAHAASIMQHQAKASASTVSAWTDTVSTHLLTR